MLSMLLMLSVKGIDYTIHFWYMTKDDVMNIMKNYNLNEKTELLEKIFSTYKNRGTTYY